MVASSPYRGLGPLWHADHDVKASRALDGEGGRAVRVDRKPGDHFDRNVARQVTERRGGGDELVDQQSRGAALLVVRVGFRRLPEEDRVACRKTPLFSAFPYACPESVWANWSIYV